MRKPYLLQGKAINQNISLPENLAQALKERAIQEDRPISRVVRRALFLYLNHQAPQDEQID